MSQRFLWCVKVPKNAFASSSCEDVQFLKNIVTGDESCVCGYDPETKQQSSQWKSPMSPRPKKAPGAKQNRGHVTGVFWLRVSYTTTTLPTGKQLTRNSTWRSCDVYVNQFAENDQKYGGMATGSCTMTIRPHTLHILCSSFGQARHRSVAAATILTRSCTVWLFPVPKA